MLPFMLPFMLPLPFQTMIERDVKYSQSLFIPLITIGTEGITVVFNVGTYITLGGDADTAGEEAGTMGTTTGAAAADSNLSGGGDIDGNVELRCICNSSNFEKN